MVHHTMTKSPELGKVFLELIFGCLNWCEMSVADMNSLFLMVRWAIGQDNYQNEESRGKIEERRGNRGEEKERLKRVG